MSECEIPKFNSNRAEIIDILDEAKTIAVVGLSPKEERPSHGIYLFLKSRGYQVFGVNPGFDQILGDKVYKSISDIPVPIDIVDIFRRSEEVPALVDEAIKIKAKVIWMQEGVINNLAADKARKAGIKVVMNKCIYKERVSV